LSAAEIPHRIYEHAITEIRLAADEDVSFVAIRPAEQEVSEVATINGVAITAPPGRYKAIVVAITDGKFDRSRKIVKYFDCVKSDTPEPGPEPDPDVPPAPDVTPGPRPEGFAGDVFDQITRARLGYTARKLSVAADVVLTKLDAQTTGAGPRVFNTSADCVVDFASQIKLQQLPATWQPVLRWIADQAKANAMTFVGVRAVLDGVRLGARRAAGDTT
jgi:hypothetical protein